MRAYRVLLFLLAVVATGCGSASTPASTPPAGLKIAVIAKSSVNPVFLSARTGAEAAARELSTEHNVPVEIVWLPTLTTAGVPFGAASFL